MQINFKGHTNAQKRCHDLLAGGRARAGAQRAPPSRARRLLQLLHTAAPSRLQPCEGHIGCVSCQLVLGIRHGQQLQAHSRRGSTPSA